MHRNNIQMQRIKHIFGLVFILSLFLVYLAETTMFSHSHDIDGVKVVHSHPYSSTQHTHSDSQIIAIALLSSFNSTEQISEFLKIETPQSLILAISIYYEDFYVSNLICDNQSLRAPPVRC